jgi:transcriptional regulator with XRE-family HTH domain
MKDEREDLDNLDDPTAGLLAEVLVRRLLRRHGQGRLERLAELVGLSARTLQRYMKGTSTPSQANLVLLAREAGLSQPLLERLQRALDAHRLAESALLASEPAAIRQPFAARLKAAVLESLEEAGDLFHIELAPQPWEDTGKPRPEDRRRADELWRRFTGFKNREDAYRLVRESTAFRHWSFAERLAHESQAAVATSAAEALALAELATEIARTVPGTPSWRARVEAYALLALGNACRACDELDRSRAAFAQAQKLRSAFLLSDPPLLDESSCSLESEPEAHAERGGPWS